MAAENYRDSEAIHLQALENLKSLGNVYWTGHLLRNLSRIYLASSDIHIGQPYSLLSDALEIGQLYDYPIVTALSLAGMSEVAHRLNFNETAAIFIGLVRAILDEACVRLQPPDQRIFDKISHSILQCLGEQRYDQVIGNGGSMLIHEA